MGIYCSDATGQNRVGDRLKIVLIHHYYKNGSASGENTVVDAHVSALRNNGHQVTLISEDSKKIASSWILMLKTGISWATNLGNNPLRQIKKLKPDLIIIHNLYPGFSSRWMNKINIPKLYWLHNYRFFCIAATFIFKNQECLLCAKKISYKSLLRKCADGSVPKTIFTFLRLKINRKLPEQSNLDQWISVSPKAKKLFLQTPLDKHRVSMIPNFVEQVPLKRESNRENKWVFVGRLVPEKGILALVASIPESIVLDIFGDGPAREQLEALASSRKNVHIKGDFSRDSLLALLPNYSGGFVPSLGIEGIPTTFLEFASAGLPIIGWSVNSTSDYIDQYRCGVTLNSFNQEDIAAAIKEIENNIAFYSQNSLRMWESEFSESRWVERVNKLFESVLGLKDQES